ncbi:MAG TPA: hypothetical protein VHW00_05630 [Thermoanaerobaculia bacterium]|nr:hypothetical protein [Thermoanaerobaculia bacterium]
MRSLLLLLAFTAPLFADCTSSMYPAQTKSMEFRQTTKSFLGESVFRLAWSDRRVSGNVLTFAETFTPEEGEPRQSIAKYRCKTEGVQPIEARGTGVQYGNDLTPGSEWKWSWDGDGISASYVYHVMKIETVTVPAGTYDAVRIDYTGKALSETRGALPEITGTLWIVEGIGLVKQYDNDPALGLFPDETTLELIAIE